MQPSALNLFKTIDPAKLDLLSKNTVAVPLDLFEDMLPSYLNDLSQVEDSLSALDIEARPDDDDGESSPELSAIADDHEDV